MVGSLGLDKELDQDEEITIIDFLWRANPSKHTLARYEPYLAYYKKEMKSLQSGFYKESFLLPRMAAQSYQDLRKIISILSDNRASALSDTRTTIKELFPGQKDDAVNLSIHLALKVWLTIDAHLSSSEVSGLGVMPKELLADASSLTSLVGRSFPSTSAEVAPAESWLDPHFTAYHLTRDCKITIDWTHF
ncbi:MAG: hypothetical protein MMC33_006159 [Icmadophila ericetorum]|nr:hypothetical protein [Icmadophila ericetorum]